MITRADPPGRSAAHRPGASGDPGRRLAVRELGPGADAELGAVFAGLSARSRYLRFHSPMHRLAPGMRRALTAVGGRRHIALVAIAGLDPIGIARCVGLGAGRRAGGRGGRRLAGPRRREHLLRALRERAVEAGYDTLVAEVLAENDAGVELTLTLPLTDAWSFDASGLLSA